MLKSDEELLNELKNRLEYYKISNKELIERLKGTEDALWADGKYNELKEKYEKLLRETKYSFIITEEEHEKIKKFKEEHKGNFGTIGGGFTYEFMPTSIGTIGTIKSHDGSELTFRDSDNW